MNEKKGRGKGVGVGVEVIISNETNEIVIYNTTKEEDRKRAVKNYNRKDIIILSCCCHFHYTRILFFNDSQNSLSHWKCIKNLNCFDVWIINLSSLYSIPYQ